jgi:hypothetical protein
VKSRFQAFAFKCNVYRYTEKETRKEQERWIYDGSTTADDRWTDERWIYDGSTTADDGTTTSSSSPDSGDSVSAALSPHRLPSSPPSPLLIQRNLIYNYKTLQRAPGGAVQGCESS